MISRRWFMGLLGAAAAAPAAVASAPKQFLHVKLPPDGYADFCGRIFAAPIPEEFKLIFVPKHEKWMTFEEWTEANGYRRGPTH